MYTGGRRKSKAKADVARGSLVFDVNFRRGAQFAKLALNLAFLEAIYQMIVLIDRANGPSTRATQRTRRSAA